MMQRNNILKYLVIGILPTIIMLGLHSCRTPKLTTARQQMARGEYYDAAKTYRQVYNKLTKPSERPQRAIVAKEMGDAHRELSQWARAAAAYQNAIRYGNPDSTAQLRMAQMQQADGQYAAAIRSYEEYLMRAPGSQEAMNGLLGARWAQNARNNPTRHVVKQATLFNTRRADFAPMLCDDQLYITTTNEKATGDNRSEITGMKKSDIWVAKKDEQGKWQRPEPIEGDINTPDDEGIVSFSSDGNTMYLTKARRLPNAHTGVEIYTSTRSDATWSAPVKFEVFNDTISSYGHPSVSPNGEYLYFTSDMPGEGGKDIWRISLKERAGSLENLGSQINTSGNEEFPYAYTDSILYFSSNGHPGLGGLDIFKAILQPDGSWKVHNLGYPMNSSGDDFGITFDRKSKIPSGYFSTNRTDSRGYDHIYSFELPDIRVQLNGWVVDHDGEPINGAVVRIVGNDGSNQRTASSPDGAFTFKLTPGVNYAMLAGARGFLNAKHKFATDTAQADADYEIEFTLASLSKPNIVENIFYDFDQSTLRPESKEALDQLVELLNDNPHVSIQMASHTDRIGTDEYNDALSLRRAQAVVDYLIDAGIDPKRLSSKGFGKSHPKSVTPRINKRYPQFQENTLLDEDYVNGLENEADRDAADQINRRTEFTVVSESNRIQ